MLYSVLLRSRSQFEGETGAWSFAVLLLQETFAKVGSLVHTAPDIAVAIGLSNSADGVVIKIDELSLQPPLVVFIADIQSFGSLP